MTEDEVFIEHLSTLSTEVLLYIFTYLPGKQLMRCRQVCERWKQIIDGLARRDILWRDHCKKDFSTVYNAARLKARSGLLWFNIYRSLSLWPRLPSAREVRDEFASASSINDQIKYFSVLRDGIISVHTQGSIVYYDSETLERSKRGPITGVYMNYTENEDTIVIQNLNLQLFVIRKVIYNPRSETNVSFDRVKMFHLVGREVYYVNLNNEIFVCNLEDVDLKSTFLKRSEESIMSLGYKGCLYFLTFQRNIYAVRNNNLELVSYLEEQPNMVDQLNKYDILERMDWRVFFQWLCILRHKIPCGPLKDITVVRTYGDIVFVGCKWGVLLIYYKPYTNGEFDFYNAEPMKQYNFVERSDCPVLSMCPIMQIEVSETEDGHRVFVGMPKKIAVLDFIHNFKRSASAAMLPYSDIERVKILKIEEDN